VFDLSHVIAYEVENDPVEGRLVVKLLSGDLSGKVIVIDPGHGGEDPGAVVNGVMEKNINLQMAIALKAFLEDQGAKVILTRETDVFVTLADRVDLANTNHADLMICIHNNATEGPTGLEGSLILYKDTQWMPLYKLAHRAIAARTGVLGLGPVRDQRGIYILRRCEIPVLFVEASFMTNAIDFARLTDASAAYEKNVMMGVTDGVLAYYQGRDLPPVQYPENVRLADAGIFDLGGKPLEFADGGSAPSDSGSAWDNPDQTAEPASDETAGSGDAASNSETSSDDSSNAGQDGNGDDYGRRRGRGAYRFN
jgi:N-acetylmuramoyl-L-alanine amidase